ncbi:MAG: cytochrome c oxidase subunit II [Chloroflexi bacterium]|nr:cytochrome c oxidase subunit II [Chloroflexota bacterium]
MPKRVSRLVAGVALFASLPLFSACDAFSSPQNTFAPAGEVAADQKFLFLMAMWPALVIGLFVEIGLVAILIKFRHRTGDTTLPVQVHGNNRLEIGWTVAPILLLAVFVPFVIGGIVKLGRTPVDSMVVNVTGVQWAWQFAYPTTDGSPPINAPINELRIPVDRNIAFTLRSMDVNHSFWVPKLAGKTDVIPGRENRMWFKASEVGDYSGQCAEFCGLDHARMRFRVIVMSQADFDAWLKEQAAAQRPAGNAEAKVSGE